MTFTFNTGIPAANNNPSVDQPDMLTNNQSTDGILAVDHISFNTANGGTHKQVTFDNVAAPGAQTNPQSILYTVAGVASSVSDMRFRNQNKIFPVNLIRAYGFVNGAAGGIIASQSINVTSAVRNSAGNYTITLEASTVASANFAVLITCTPRPVPGLNPMSTNYSITGVGTFTILIYDLFSNSLADPTNFSFVVLQI